MRRGKEGKKGERGEKRENGNLLLQAVNLVGVRLDFEMGFVGF